MPLVDFTSFDDIRAALGVSEDEIEDATLSLPLYEINLTAELEDVGDDLITLFSAQKDGTTLTADQKRFGQYVQVFSTYAVAKQLSVSLALFSPKEITDGKASMVRYAQNPYIETIKRVAQEFDRWRTKLDGAYRKVKSLSAGTAAVQSLMFISTPSSDPITGS